MCVLCVCARALVCVCVCVWCDFCVCGERVYVSECVCMCLASGSDSLSLSPFSGTHLCAVEASAVLKPKLNSKLNPKSCAEWRDSGNTQTLDARAVLNSTLTLKEREVLNDTHFSYH